MENKTIKTFRDLEVYQNSYQSMLLVFKHIIPKLPPEEKYDLKEQLLQSCKAIPRLIAEGHSKRHQIRGFQKYIDDAMAEANETIVSLSQARDLYAQLIDCVLCEKLLDAYDKTGRQLFKLSLAWDNFPKHDRRMTFRAAIPHDEKRRTDRHD